MSDLRFVYMTAATRDDALALARALVEARLVACVNILDRMTAVFWWEGKAQQESEVALIAKTRADRIEALTRKVRDLHDYDVPCVVSLPIAGDEGNPDFLDWIRSEASGNLN